MAAAPGAEPDNSYDSQCHIAPRSRHFLTFLKAEPERADRRSEAGSGSGIAPKAPEAVPNRLQGFRSPLLLNHQGRRAS